MKAQAGQRTSGRSGWSRVEPGDYFRSSRDLFVVEQVNGGHALVEDCKTGDLIDVPLAELARLEPVRTHD